MYRRTRKHSRLVQFCVEYIGVDNNQIMNENGELLILRTEAAMAAGDEKQLSAAVVCRDRRTVPLPRKDYIDGCSKYMPPYPARFNEAFQKCVSLMQVRKMIHFLEFPLECVAEKEYNKK